MLESHPVWVRGLKHTALNHVDENMRVAPRVGAWIETYRLGTTHTQSRYVAPRVGAWIETIYMQRFDLKGFVAPRVGAWIETHKFFRKYD